MAEPWIRVHANIGGKPVVWRAAESLSVAPAEAIGLLVQFWGAVSQHATNGEVDSFPDAQLEAWAGWTRKRGKFAAFIRAHHTDEDGRVNEWDDYAGKLEDRKEKDRNRKRKSRGRHADSPQDVTDDSTPTIRDETIRTEELLLLQRSDTPEEANLAALLESDADRQALTVVLGRASDRLACVVAFTSMLTGNDPATTPTPSPGLFGQALRDMATNGDRPGARKFRNYLADAAREPSPTPIPLRRGGVAQRTFDNGRTALEGM